MDNSVTDPVPFATGKKQDEESKLSRVQELSRVSCPTVPSLLVRQLESQFATGNWNLATVPHIGGFGSNLWYRRTVNYMWFAEGPNRAWMDIQALGNFGCYGFGRLTVERMEDTPKLDWSATPALVTFNAEAALRSTGNWTRVPMLSQDAVTRLLARCGNASAAGFLFRLALVIGTITPPVLDSAMPEYPVVNHFDNYAWDTYFSTSFGAQAVVVRVNVTDQPSDFSEVGGIVWSPALARCSAQAQACLLLAWQSKWRITWTHGASRRLVWRRWDLDANVNESSSIDPEQGSHECSWYRYSSFILGRDPTTPFVVTVLVDDLHTPIIFLGQAFDNAHPAHDFTGIDIGNLYAVFGVEEAMNCAQELYNLVRLSNPTQEEVEWFYRGMSFEWGDRHTTLHMHDAAEWRQPNHLDHEVAGNPGYDQDAASFWQLWAACRAGDGMPIACVRPTPLVNTTPFYLRLLGLSAGTPSPLPASLNEVRLEAWRRWIRVSWLTTPAMTRPFEWGTLCSVYRRVWRSELQILPCPTLIMIVVRNAADLCGAVLHYSMHDHLRVDATPEPKVYNPWTVDRAGGEFVCIVGNEFTSRPRFVGTTRDLIETRYGHQLVHDSRIGYRVAYAFHPDARIQFVSRLPSTTPYKPAVQEAGFQSLDWNF